MKTKKQKNEKQHVFFQRKIVRSCMEDLKIWFYYKTAAKTFEPRIWGPGLQYSPWISYEEPLQTSCLGKNTATTLHGNAISLKK